MQKSWLACEQRGACIKVVAAIGDTVLEGTPLLRSCPLLHHAEA